LKYYNSIFFFFFFLLNRKNKLYTRNIRFKLIIKVTSRTLIMIVYKYNTHITLHRVSAVFVRQKWWGLLTILIDINILISMQQLSPIRSHHY